ncbi:hypothetical protein SAY87_018958 [Trapa incisa]|uniref:Uncharacterized protein n=1 Tax=Trapa incisa TaxID=236973 RepID=A0AAN7K3S9_9MYRT|nr:hypothetical protein SAY87_018958 [Trapa incisa]
MEDDLLFADLSKQISLLIMEDDDVVLEEEPLDPYWHYSSALQGFYRAVNNPAVLQPISAYDQVYCRSEISKGTGVFIPKSSQPRRKNSQGRTSSKTSPPSSASWSHRKINDHQKNPHTRSEATQLSRKSFILPKNL